MEHTKHIWRAVIILVALALAGVVTRQLMIPESFGETGHFRHDSIGEFMSQPLVHGGDLSCRKCHKDQYDTKEKGKHGPVPCETCHGPVTLHANDQDKIADMPMTPTYELCAKCHLAQAAKPKDFPQLDFKQHLTDQDIPVKDKIPAKVCNICHPAHDPLSE